MSIEERTKAISGKVVAGLIAAILAPIPLLWLTNSSGLSDGPVLKIIGASPLSPAYANNTYSDTQVLVDNGGKVTAEECFVRAYDARLLPEDPANSATLGESERFDLLPQDGYVATVSIYLPNVSKETSQGAVKSLVVEPFVFRAECSNAISPYV